MTFKCFIVSACLSLILYLILVFCRQEVPRERSKEQLWIYLQQECPIYTKLNLQAYPNVFNWTMTYRLDILIAVYRNVICCSTTEKNMGKSVFRKFVKSFYFYYRRDADVYAPYGQIVPMPKIVTDFNSSNSNPSITTTPPVALHKKTGLVAWIVSSCDSYSKREYLVKELQKYVTVDVYGWCGHDCPQNENCYSHVAKTHKFYLSFENSLCTDYITEKFFTAMKVDMIPVVYGGSRMQDYSSIAPHGSYIDAKSFNSVKDLAKYLIFLDKNDSDYLRYFDWKKKFKVIPGQGWCNVCQRVYEHLQASRKHNKWYKDMWKWWNYMGYDPSVEVDEHYDPLSASGQSYNYLLGEPACLSAHKNLTENPVHLDFEPGFLNGKIYGKLWSWARDLISQ